MKKRPHQAAEPARSPSPQSAHLQRLGIAAADELRKTVQAALTSLFGSFVERLPAILTETALQANDAREQHAFEELARAASDGAESWTEIFVRQVDANLIGGVVDNPGFRKPPASAPEDSIALAKALLHAESLHHKLIAELDTRVDRIRLALYVPIYTRALAPAGLCRALQDTADTLGWPAAQRRVLFGKFDELVVSELQHLYLSLIGALKIIGTVAARAMAESEGPAASTQELPPTAGDPATPVPAGKADQPLPKVDSNTLSMLESYALRAGDEIYNDGSLATDLLTLAQNKPLPGLAEDKNWVPLQRMTLAGRFLNEAIADPFVSKEMREQQASVRFPVVKSALADSTMFTAATHPINSLVNDLMLKSATSRLTGDAEARRAVERLEQILVQFDLAPEFVREAMLTQQPIDEAQIQRFFDMKREEARQRRQTIINEVKRLVLREIELSSFGRRVLPSAVNFLRTVWGPLMMKRLLQHGAEHALWKEALGLMEQLIDQLDDPFPEQLPSLLWQELMQALEKALATDGMAAERAAEAIASLQAARPTKK